jgi:hypothetical protein
LKFFREGKTGFSGASVASFFYEIDFIHAQRDADQSHRGTHRRQA